MKISKQFLLIVFSLCAVSFLAFTFSGKDTKVKTPQVPAAVSGSKATLGEAKSASQEMQKMNADFPNMMGQLSKSMESWNQYAPENQAAAVRAVIGLYKSRQNTAILKDPDFYVERISQSLNGNQTLRALPIQGVLRILAIMEYDFYNGQDKDELARQALGEKLFAANKRRIQLLESRR